MEDFSAEQIKVFQKMTPAQKLDVTGILYQMAWSLKEAGLRSLYPDLSEDQIRQQVRDLFSVATSDY